MVPFSEALDIFLEKHAVSTWKGKIKSVGQCVNECVHERVHICLCVHIHVCVGTVLL